MSDTDGACLLVLGAQGFLGRHVVAQWLAADPGHRVLALGRSARSVTHFTQTVEIRGRESRMPLPSELTVSQSDAHRIAYIEGDVGRPEVTDQVIAQHPVDAVVHAAAALRDDPLTELLNANVLSVVHLTRAIATWRPGLRLVFVSSGSVNALCAAGGDPPNAYTVTKSAGEQVAAAAAGVDTVVARVHNLVGAGLQARHLPARVALELAERGLALEQRPTASGVRPLRTGPLDASRDLIDAADAARAVLAAVGARGSGLPASRSLGAPVIDVGTGRSRTMSEVVSLQIAAAGLSERVQVEQVSSSGGGPSDLVADPRAMVGLGVTPRIPLERSLAAMADYARNQLLATGAFDNRSTSGESAASSAGSD